MSVFTDLYDAHLTIGGHAITWREILGNAFGLASAVGGMRRKVWAWPVGIVGNVLLFTVFLFTATESDHGGSPLYGQAARQVFFVIVSVYGWWRWSTEPAQRRRCAGRRAALGHRPGARWRTSRRPPSGWWPATSRSAAIGAGFPAEWWFYLADAWIFVGSIVATYAMARGWVDFWLCWIAVDLVGVPLLLHSHFYPSAVLYGVYGAVRHLGLRHLAADCAHRGGQARRRRAATGRGAGMSGAGAGWTRRAGDRRHRGRARPSSSSTTRTARTRATSSSPRPRRRPALLAFMVRTPPAWCACRWRAATWTGSSCRR